MARIQTAAPVAATAPKLPPAAGKAPPPKGAAAPAAPGKAPPTIPGKAPPAPVKASGAPPVTPSVAYVTREDFDGLKAYLAGQNAKIEAMAETIAKLHKAAGSAPKGGKLAPRAIADLLDCPNPGDWRDAYQDAARGGWRPLTHHFRTDEHDEILWLDREATPKIPMLLCIPRDSEPEGAKARAQGLLASYSAFSEDGEHVIGEPACYLSEEEVGQIRAD